LTSIQLFGQKKILLCGEWVQFGYKAYNESNFKIIKEGFPIKKCQFKCDGTYWEDFLWKDKRKWTFNSDSTRIGFKFTEFMGKKIKDESPINSFETIIIKLTADTLVYGHDMIIKRTGYFGNDSTSGRDAWYFVKKK